jgi:hypothetical protein
MRSCSWRRLSELSRNFNIRGTCGGSAILKMILAKRWVTSVGDFTRSVCLLVFWLAVFVDRLLAEVVCFDTVTLCSISLSLLYEGGSGAFYFLILPSDLLGISFPAAPVAFSPDLVARGVLKV